MSESDTTIQIEERTLNASSGWDRDTALKQKTRHGDSKMITPGWIALAKHCNIVENLLEV